MKLAGTGSAPRSLGTAAAAGDRLVKLAGAGSAPRSLGTAAATGDRLVKLAGTGRDRKSTRLNSSHSAKSRMPSSA